jgi:hypothetical protein
LAVEPKYLTRDGDERARAAHLCECDRLVAGLVHIGGAVRSERPLVRFRNFTVRADDGSSIACVTIGGLASALGLSVVHTRRLIDGGYLPAAPYGGPVAFDHRIQLWPVTLVEALERAAVELGVGRRNVRRHEWSRLRRRAAEMLIEIEPWPFGASEVRERPERWRNVASTHR